jgi:hypothetical protein
VELTDGKTVSCTVEYLLGEPENPLSAAATREKFRNNTRGLLSHEEQERIERVLDVPGGEPLPSALSDGMLAKLFL